MRQQDMIHFMFFIRFLPSIVQVNLIVTEETKKSLSFIENLQSDEFRASYRKRLKVISINRESDWISCLSV